MSHLMLRKTQKEPYTTDVWGLQSDINRLFDAFMNPLERTMPEISSFKMNVAELEDRYEINAELPGTDEKDINLSVEDGFLCIRGEKKAQKEDEKKGYYLKECSYGSFSRTVQLPDNIADDKIAAHFENGVLTIDIPKKTPSAAKSRKITITTK